MENNLCASHMFFMSVNYLPTSLGVKIKLVTIAGLSEIDSQNSGGDFVPGNGNTVNFWDNLFLKNLLVL